MGYSTTMDALTFTFTRYRNRSSLPTTPIVPFVQSSPSPHHCSSLQCFHSLIPLIFLLSLLSFRYMNKLCEVLFTRIRYDPQAPPEETIKEILHQLQTLLTSELAKIGRVLSRAMLCVVCQVMLYRVNVTERERLRRRRRSKNNAN